MFGVGGMVERFFYGYGFQQRNWTYHLDAEVRVRLKAQRAKRILPTPDMNGFSTWSTNTISKTKTEVQIKVVLQPRKLPRPKLDLGCSSSSILIGRWKALLEGGTLRALILMRKGISKRHFTSSAMKARTKRSYLYPAVG